MPVCACTSRRGQGAGQPHPRRGRGVAQLPAPARTRRCPRCRRSVCSRRLGTDSAPIPLFRRRWRDRSVGAAAADRRQPRRTRRLETPDTGSDRLARGGVALTANTAPLAGIRILEVGTMLAGPYATMLLADLGAGATKSEPRGGETPRGGGSSYFASLNRNKSSVCLDLNSDAGQQRLGELVSESHALLVNLKPSAIRRLGLTYEQLRRWNQRIVCVAITGFGLYGGDDPAFDYVVQAGVGIAALTGDPDGPPTLPGYSSADNSTGMCAALGLLAKIVSGTGGQVDVSLRDVMFSQLNYHASAYLNNGVEPQRRPNGAHSYYVPAQLFQTADGYLALFITHDGFWKSFATEAGIGGFETMAERVARRDEVLGVVTSMLATDTAAGWERRLRPLGVPAAAVRTLPEALKATPEGVVTAGDFRLVGSPIHVAGYQPEYRPPPELT